MACNEQHFLNYTQRASSEIIQFAETVRFVRRYINYDTEGGQGENIARTWE